MQGPVWKHHVDLRTVYTPVDRWIKVKPGAVDTAIVERLRRRKYDQAPVVGLTSKKVGIIGIEELELLSRNNQLLFEENNNLIDYTVIPVETTLQELLSTLSSKRAAIVTDKYDAEGLITISDINKHQIRAVLYSILAELEVGLANFISYTCQDHREWLKELSKEHQAHIVGWWHVSKEAGVDTGPLTSCTLTHLLSILEKTERVRSTLGYKSKHKVNEKFGRLPDFRNRIMHPVRDLVLERSDVSDIKETIDRIDELSSRIKEHKSTRRKVRLY